MKYLISMIVTAVLAGALLTGCKKPADPDAVKQEIDKAAETLKDGVDKTGATLEKAKTAGEDALKQAETKVEEVKKTAEDTVVKTEKAIEAGKKAFKEPVKPDDADVDSLVNEIVEETKP